MVNTVDTSLTSYAKKEQKVEKKYILERHSFVA